MAKFKRKYAACAFSLCSREHQRARKIISCLFNYYNGRRYRFTYRRVSRYTRLASVSRSKSDTLYLEILIPISDEPGAQRGRFEDTFEFATTRDRIDSSSSMFLSIIALDTVPSRPLPRVIFSSTVSTPTNRFSRVFGVEDTNICNRSPFYVYIRTVNKRTVSLAYLRTTKSRCLSRGTSIVLVS